MRSDMSSADHAGTRKAGVVPIDTDEQLRRYLRERSNWGRWGVDDQRGAVNLVTSAKVKEAAASVRTGTSVSLSRGYPVTPGPQNPQPAQQFRGTWSLDAGAGIAHEHIGISFHGLNATHIDALCHVWDGNGTWGGRDPADIVGTNGASFGDIDQWSSGITTRGVLVDVPRFRGVDHVRPGEPVTSAELTEIVESQDVEVRPGDALVVHSGRAAWERTLDPTRPMPEVDRPGLHASCLEFLREMDVSVLVWDLMEEKPTGFTSPFTVHAAIFAFGVALVDNASLEGLADACAVDQRYDFCQVLAPLRLAGGTGGPINPIAIL